jgi:hypothetical protein
LSTDFLLFLSTKHLIYRHLVYIYILLMYRYPVCRHLVYRQLIYRQHVTDSLSTFVFSTDILILCTGIAKVPYLYLWCCLMNPIRAQASAATGVVRALEFFATNYQNGPFRKLFFYKIPTLSLMLPGMDIKRKIT